MKGIITFYINFALDAKQEMINQKLDMIRSLNKDIFNKIASEDNYQIVIVPISGEACRIEKVDFDKPHPRTIDHSIGSN